MVQMPGGYPNFRPWNNVGPRQLMMPRPTRPQVTYNYTSNCCNNNNDIGNGAWWALGIGAGVGLLPTILSWFGIGGGGGAKTDGANQKNTDTSAQTERANAKANLEKIYKDQGYTIIDQDGKFYAFKDGQKVAEGATFEELQAAMPKATTKPEQKPTGLANQKTLNDLGSAKGLTVKCENGEYTITDSSGKELYKGSDINAALKAISNYTVSTPKPVIENKNIGDITPEQLEALKTEAQTKGLTDVEVKYNDDGTYTVTYTQNGEKKTITANDLDGIKKALGITQEQPPVDDKGIVDNDGKVDDKAPVKTGGKFKFPELPTGFQWKKANNPEYNGKKVEDLVNELNKKYPNLGITIDQITAANPTAIKDGVVVDTNKLDLPTVKDTTPSKGFSAAEKAKPMVIRMVFDKNDAATVVTPDGQVYTTEKASDANKAAEDLNTKLKAAGWTNITIRNDNFKVNSAATNTTNFNKTRPYSVRMVIDRSANVATAMTPDGVNHRATNDVDALQKVLKDAGWTNITLVTKSGKWDTEAVEGSTNGTSAVQKKNEFNQKAKSYGATYTPTADGSIRVTSKNGNTQVFSDQEKALTWMQNEMTEYYMHDAD